MTPTAALGNRRWLALGGLAVAGLAVGVDGTVLSVALPTLSNALHASEFDLQWFSSGYFLVLVAAMLPAGLLGDRYGRKKALLTSVHQAFVHGMDTAFLVSAGIALAGVALTVLFLPRTNTSKKPLESALDTEGGGVGSRPVTTPRAA